MGRITGGSSAIKPVTVIIKIHTRISAVLAIETGSQASAGNPAYDLRSASESGSNHSQHEIISAENT